MCKGQKRKKRCRTHQDKIIFDPISKGIAQRRNTQMKARKDNAKEKDKALSCLAAYRQQKLKQKRTQKQRLSFLHSTLEGAVTFFFSTLSLWTLGASTKREARKKIILFALPSLITSRAQELSRAQNYFCGFTVPGTLEGAGAEPRKEKQKKNFIASTKREARNFFLSFYRHSLDCAVTFFFFDAFPLNLRRGHEARSAKK